MKNVADNLSSIEDLYKYLDEHALILARKRNLKNLLVAFRDKAIDISEKELAQWELEIFLFSLKGHNVFSYAYSAGKSAGDYQQYPSIEDFKNKSAAYLLARSV